MSENKTQDETCRGTFCTALLRKGEKPNPGRAPHTCPFQEDIYGDADILCNCCENCAHECAMDI